MFIPIAFLVGLLNPPPSLSVQGDGVYAPSCSDFASHVSVSEANNRLTFTNNSGRMLAVFRIYNQNQSGAIRELDNRWAAGAQFSITKPYDNRPFGYRIIVIEAAKMAPLGNAKGACEMEAWQLAFDEHHALCDQIGGSSGCRQNARMPQR